MVAERAFTQTSRPKFAMARASLGSGSWPLGEEIMEAVGDDLEQSRLPVGLGVGVGGQLAQQAESPAGRRGFSGLPRTPQRASILAFTPPQAGEGVQDLHAETMQAPAVTEPRAAGAEQEEEEVEEPGRREFVFLENTRRSVSLLLLHSLITLAYATITYLID